MVIWLILLAVLVGATVLPLVCGFWPVGVLTVAAFTVIAFGFVWWSDDQGEAGLNTILPAFLLIIAMWLGVGLAGLISIFI